MKEMKGKLVACATAFALILGGCAQNATPADTTDSTSTELTSTAGITPAGIQERGYLLVGTSGDYCPLSMREAEDTYWGLDADLAQDLADDLGVELRYVETSWPTLLEDTMAAKFDLAMCGISITEERQAKALMSDAYLANGKTVLMRAEDVDKYTSLDDINQPGVRVMENPGGTNEKLAREWLPNADITIHDVNDEIPGLIAEGEADVMITETCEAGYYAGIDDRLAAPLIDEPFSRGEIGVLMNAENAELRDYVNDFLAREEASGRLEELRNNYIYGVDASAEEELDLAA